MLDTAGLVILHGCIAALLVEALLRVWRVQAPGERLALRWLALVAPLVVPAVFHFLVPARSAEAFGTDRALFAGDHWNQLALGEAGAASIATVALVAVGALLYLRDTIPFLDDRIRGLGEGDIVSGHPALARVTTLLAGLEQVVGSPRMAVVLLDRQAPVLLCSGVDRPTLVISTGTLSRLRDDELRAALAHELAHAARRDPLMGWLLMVVRTLAFFSPAAQVVARQVVQEVEYRADMVVARLGYSAALGRAIAILSETAESESDLVPARPAGGFPRTLLARAERVAVANRCERVLSQGELSVQPGLATVRVGLAAVGLATLLFFVV